MTRWFPRPPPAGGCDRSPCASPSGSPRLGGPRARRPPATGRPPPRRLPALTPRQGRSRRPAGSTWRRSGPNPSGKVRLRRRPRQGTSIDGKDFFDGVSISVPPVRFTVKGEQTMKYLLLIHDEEQAWGKLSERDRNAMYAEYGQFGQSIQATGNYIAGAQVHPTSSATSVRLRDGNRLVTEGPSPETRQQ